MAGGIRPAQRLRPHHLREAERAPRSMSSAESQTVGGTLAHLELAGFRCFWKPPRPPLSTSDPSAGARTRTEERKS